MHLLLSSGASFLPFLLSQPVLPSLLSQTPCFLSVCLSQPRRIQNSPCRRRRGGGGGCRHQHGQRNGPVSGLQRGPSTPAGLKGPVNGSALKRPAGLWPPERSLCLPGRLLPSCCRPGLLLPSCCPPASSGPAHSCRLAGRLAGWPPHAECCPPRSAQPRQPAAAASWPPQNCTPLTQALHPSLPPLHDEYTPLLCLHHLALPPLTCTLLPPFHHAARLRWARGWHPFYCGRRSCGGGATNGTRPLARACP